MQILIYIPKRFQLKFILFEVETNSINMLVKFKVSLYIEKEIDMIIF